MIECVNCHFFVHSKCFPTADSHGFTCHVCLSATGNTLTGDTEEIKIDVSESEDSIQVDSTEHPQQAKKGKVPSSPQKQQQQHPSRKYNLISEYINGADCADTVKSFLRKIQIPKRHPEFSSKANFEFCPTVHVNDKTLIYVHKRPTEVRELKPPRGRKITRFGVFVSEPCSPGTFIDVYLGHTHLMSTLLAKANNKFLQPCLQPFILCVPDVEGLVIDARRSGNEMRFMRRSCRPNVVIKPVITPDQLFIGVFAMNGIRAGEELLAPLDGLPLLKYECACQTPDYCLAPIDLMPEPPLKRRDDEDSFLLPAGFQLTSSNQQQQANDRKLSREERKLQRYIEFFEKMDAMDAATNNRKRKDSKKSTGESPKTPSPRESIGDSPVKPDIKVSPKPLSSSSNPSSPNRTVHNLKKQWLSAQLTQTPHGDTTPIIDVVTIMSPRPSPVLPGASVDVGIASPIVSSQTPEPHTISSIQTTNNTNTLQETPRKRLSLHDYLEKKRKQTNSSVEPHPEAADIGVPKLIGVDPDGSDQFPSKDTLPGTVDVHKIQEAGEEEEEEGEIIE